jgi:hypothetical protein
VRGRAAEGGGGRSHTISNWLSLHAFLNHWRPTLSPMYDANPRYLKVQDETDEN